MRDEKLKVLQALRPITGTDVDREVVAGQYVPGLVDGQAAASYQTDAERPGSTTETFVAIKAHVQNWRWAGVPFYLRTGKRMSERVSEIVIQFKDVPHPMFPGSEGETEPNRLVLRLQPDEGMKLHMTAKEPGPGGIRLRPVSLDLSYAPDLPAGLPRGLRAPPDGRRPRQPHPVHAPRRGRGRLDLGGADPRALVPSRARSPAPTTPAPTGPAPPSTFWSATAAPGTSEDTPMNRMHPVVADVTARITERSRAERTAYLERLEAAAERGPARGRLACANLAHGFAASGPTDKAALRGKVKPNVAIVSAYNDMLSAHQPFESFPAQLKRAVIRSGGIAQFAGGVPAMCDGITQGREGMQLSLFSRDVIAMSTAIALSHDMFDATLMLGVCDKIVPGMLIGALSFGHLPTVFVPAGPMTSGLPNSEKAAVRQRYAAGEIGREELLEAESASYHSAGTCTFYGTANSNQMLMEVMGLHLPGASFVNPGTPLRAALTDAAAARATALTTWGESYTPVGRIVDEKAIVNGCVALLATGGSTNHTLHLVAIARAAGITLTWDDLSELSAVVPSLARVYPNGSADVNHFHAAGGLAFTIHSLLKAGLLHDDVQTVAGHGLWRYTTEARLTGSELTWEEGPKHSHDTDVLRGADEPVRPRRRAADARRQPRSRGDQDLRGQARAPSGQGPGTGLRGPVGVPGGVLGRHPDRRLRRRGPLPGSGRQRHAGAAQAHPGARGDAGPRPAGRAGHRRPDVRRVGQGAGRDPPHPRGLGRRSAAPRCATAT